jgi:hypothetical protein
MIFASESYSSPLGNTYGLHYEAKGLWNLELHVNIRWLNAQPYHVTNNSTDGKFMSYLPLSWSANLPTHVWYARNMSQQVSEVLVAFEAIQSNSVGMSV